MQLFNKERQLIEQTIIRERQMMVCFALGGILGTTIPLFAPKLPRELKLFSLLYGVVSSTGFTFGVHTRVRKEKIYQTLDIAQAASLASQMKHTIAQDNALQRINAERQLAGYIAQLPKAEQQRWIQMYQLQGILPPAIVDVSVEEVELTDTTIVPSQPSFNDFDNDLEDIDYSWLDDKFVIASKGIFGAKGSGKSTYLAYEAISFLQIYPDGELRIGDIHFDEEESVWLPGVPPQLLLQKYVANNPQQILNTFRRAQNLLRDRISAQNRKAQPFKLICDEFVGFLSRLDDDQRSEVLQIIQQIQFEGRKYGVDCTLALHSIKKEQSGIDSSVLANMDLLALGNSIADPNIKLPADFDIKALVKEQQRLQATLKPNQGYACIVRKLGDMPRVQVIPNIDLSQYQISVAEKNWIEEMKNWVQSVRSTAQTPTPQQVFEKWLELTSISLDEQGLQLLLEHLGL